MTFKALSSPYELGSLKLKNRIVMPPMVIWASDESGEVKQAHLDHYAEHKGPGLIIVEATTVSPEGRLRETQLGIFDDRHLEGLRSLADTIKSGGAAAGIQIHHAGGKATPEITYGRTPLVPSKEGYPADKVCAELEESDIRRIIGDFAAGARRAVLAGFQLIELHGAHGYLGCQFLSPLTNKRTDRYGGSLENRQRFLLELYREVAAAVGGKAMVTYRLGVAEEPGLPIDEGLATVCRLADAGMPLVHASNAHSVPESLALADGRFSPVMNLGIRVRRETALPTIGVGGILDPAMAEILIAENLVDLVAVGRSLLADSQWAFKTLAGRSGEIIPCRRCKPCRWFKDPALCPARRAV